MSDGEVCMMNIGPKERRKRMRFGIAGFALGFAALAGLLAAGTTPGWRLLVFLPFLLGATGYFQARDKT